MTEDLLPTLLGLSGSDSDSEDDIAASRLFLSGKLLSDMAAMEVAGDTEGGGVIGPTDNNGELRSLVATKQSP